MHRKLQFHSWIILSAMAPVWVVDWTSGIGWAQEIRSLRDPRPVQEAPKRAVKLGARDDSLAESYSLENRGKETPAGKPTGRYATEGMHRAGYPWIPGLFANVGTDPQHSIGYVGGSTPFKGPASRSLQGECRTSQEGTFGADYSGLYFKRNTWLLWTHGRREQGGLGRYETDGPRILPEK